MDWPCQDFTQRSTIEQPTTATGLYTVNYGPRSLTRVVRCRAEEEEEREVVEEAIYLSVAREEQESSTYRRSPPSTA